MDIATIQQRVRRGLLELPDQLRDVSPAKPDQAYRVKFANELVSRRDVAMTAIKTELEKQAKRYEL